MSAQAARASRIGWGPLLVVGIGVGILLLGARGYYHRGTFGFSDALVCALLLVPAAFLLLLVSYVVQHAIFVSVIPLLFIALLVYTYPAFALAMGVAVLGAVLGPAVSEWRKQE